MNSETCDRGETGILRTPLYSTHISLGARMMEFHGWEMPVEYSDIIGEHKAVRGSAGLFDVSHMNKLIVRGDEAFDFLKILMISDSGAALIEKWLILTRISPVQVIRVRTVLRYIRAQKMLCICGSR